MLRSAREILHSQAIFGWSSSSHTTFSQTKATVTAWRSTVQRSKMEPLAKTFLSLFWAVSVINSSMAVHLYLHLDPTKHILYAWWSFKATLCCKQIFYALVNYSRCFIVNTTIYVVVKWSSIGGHAHAQKLIFCDYKKWSYWNQSIVYLNSCTISWLSLIDTICLVIILFFWS